MICLLGVCWVFKLLGFCMVVMGVLLGRIRECFFFSVVVLIILIAGRLVSVSLFRR